MIRKNLLDAIGNTPMVEIARMNPSKKVKIYAKLEGRNPTGSLKDRIAKYMIEKAESKGVLAQGKVILEATSGNTGISLSFVAKLKGYKVKAVMPDNVSVERRELLDAYGAELVLSEGEKGPNGAIELAQQIAEGGDYFLPDQYSNPNNVLAHYQTTGQEILRDLGGVDVFVAGLGTGGTLMGVGKRLREANPKTKIIAVQPYPKGGLQGLRNITEGFIPSIVDLDSIDESYVVKDEDAFSATKRLLDEEGIFAGISSGAVIHVAAEIAKKIPGGTIATVFADDGWKYLSHKIWTRSPEEVSQEYLGPPW